ncbi:MAG: hypothetical protein M0Z80_12715 [Treponema sp.]|nr:hypothetical protein [Treponema sp.]
MLTAESSVPPGVTIPEGCTYYLIEEVGLGWMEIPGTNKSGAIIGSLVPDGMGELMGGAVNDILHP